MNLFIPTNIVNEVVTIQNYMFSIGTALAVLMLTVAGLYIMLDRDVSTHKRSARLAFVRSILVGYGIILGANLLVSVLVSVMGGIGTNGMPTPATPAIHETTDLVNWSCTIYFGPFQGPDPCHAIADQINGFFHFLQDLLAVIVNVPANFTYELDGIQALAGLFRVIAFLMLTIIVMVGGFQMMIGRATGIDYTPPGEFIPRIVAAAIASYFSMLICQTLIDLTNAIANAELLFTVNFVLKKGGGAIALFGGLLVVFGSQIATDPIVIILLIILLILLLIAILKGCARIALIDLLIVVAPLAIVLWILPQTRKWAAFWFTLFTTTLAEVILEDLVFCLVLVILFSNSAQNGDDLLRIIIAISAIFLMTRMSHLLGRMGGAGPHKHLAGAAFGAVLMTGRVGLAMNAMDRIGGLAQRFGLSPLGHSPFGNPTPANNTANTVIPNNGVSVNGNVRQGATGAVTPNNGSPKASNPPKQNGPVHRASSRKNVPQPKQSFP